MRIPAGQKVLIKNPRALEGTVVGDRPGDYHLPEDQRRYIVQISEVERLYLPSEIEAPQPSDVLVPYSPEWTAELQKFLDAGKRWGTNNSDHKAWDEFSAAGSKLGFFVPMDPK